MAVWSEFRRSPGRIFVYTVSHLPEEADERDHPRRRRRHPPLSPHPDDSKQLLPVYDKPMVYYPLSMLMLAGIRDVLVISTPEDLPQFRELLGTGSHWGMRFTYAEQPRPERPRAGLHRRSRVRRRPAVVLGPGRQHLLWPWSARQAARAQAGSPRARLVFGYPVRDPERYGVVEFDAGGRAIRIEEKPQQAANRIMPCRASTSTTPRSLDIAARAAPRPAARWRSPM